MHIISHSFRMVIRWSTARFVDYCKAIHCKDCLLRSCLLRISGVTCESRLMTIDCEFGY